MTERYRQITINEYLGRTARIDGVEPYISVQIERNKNIIDQVIEMVSQDFGLEPEDLLGRSRKKDVAQARQFAMSLLYVNSDLSFDAVAVCMGRREHSVSIWALNQTQKSMDEDEVLKIRFSKLSDKIQSATK